MRSSHAECRSGQTMHGIAMNKHDVTKTPAAAWAIPLFAKSPATSAPRCSSYVSIRRPPHNNCRVAASSHATFKSQDPERRWIPNYLVEYKPCYSLPSFSAASQISPIPLLLELEKGLCRTERAKRIKGQVNDNEQQQCVD